MSTDTARRGAREILKEERAETLREAARFLRSYAADMADEKHAPGVETAARLLDELAEDENWT